LNARGGEEKRKKFGKKGVCCALEFANPEWESEAMWPRMVDEERGGGEKKMKRKKGEIGQRSLFFGVLGGVGKFLFWEKKPADREGLGGRRGGKGRRSDRRLQKGMGRRK